jgi:hypothetical protein
MAARDRLDYARHDAAAERTSTLAGEYGSALQYQKKMVPGDGVEPPTLRFSVACSTN